MIQKQSITLTLAMLTFVGTVCADPISISSLTATPTAGSPPLRVEFNARATSESGISITQYLWDLNGDGFPDRITTKGKTNYTYTLPGTYSPTVQVVNNISESVTSDKNKIKVTLGAGAELSGKAEYYEYDEVKRTVHAKVRIYNTGSIAATPFKVGLILSDNGKNATTIKTMDVNGLNAHANTLLDFQYTFQDPIYGRFISVAIDTGKQIDEVDDTNNGINISIGPGATWDSLVVYSNDFTTNAGSEWSDPTLATSNGESFLSASANGFGPSSNTLTLDNLSTHGHVKVDFDLYIIQTWDGNGPAGGGADNWQLTADGQNLLFTNFANFTGGGSTDGTYFTIDNFHVEYTSTNSQYLDVTAISDVNNDGVMDQALLAQNAGKYYLRIINGASGKQLKSLSLGTATGVTFSELTVIPDINGDSAADFALLVLTGGNYSLRVVDGVTGNQLRQVSLGAAKDLTPISLTVVDDANANTYKDISILIKNTDGSNILQIRDGLMLSVLKTFKLPVK